MVVSILVVLMVTPFILLNNSKIRGAVMNGVEQIFFDATGGRLDIEDVSLQFPNRLRLQNVTLLAPDGGMIASIGQIYVHVGLKPLLHGNIVIREVEIDNLDGVLVSDSSGVLNIRFLIDAFKPTQPTSALNLKFNIITLNNASLRYLNLAGDTVQIKGVMNPDNIYVHGLNMQASLVLEDKNGVSADVAYFNLYERSGFRINDFNTEVLLSDSLWLLPRLYLELPATKFRTDSASVKLYKHGGNIDWEKTELNFCIPETKISLPDFKYFEPRLAKMTKNAYFAAELSGTVSTLRAKNLNVRYGNTLSVKMNMDANGLPDIDKAFYYCNISHIRFDRASVQDVVANFIAEPFVIPDELTNLGKCQYSGNISGFLSNLVLYGTLKTDIGNVKTDINVQVDSLFSQLRVNGKISSPNLQLGRVLPQSGLKDVGFSSISDFAIGKNTSFSDFTQLNISHLTFRNHRYNNIAIEGAFDNEHFAGKIEVDDPNGYLSFNGLMSNVKGYKTFGFNSTIKNLNLNKLNLIGTHPDLEISLTMSSDFEGDRLATMAGYMNIDSIRLLNGEKEFLMERFYLNAENGESTSASLQSDLLNGGLTGRYVLSALVDNVLQTVAKQMPVVGNFIDIKGESAGNDITAMFELEPVKEVCSVLDLPWYTTQRSSLYFRYKSDDDKLMAKITVPQITNGTVSIDSINISGDNDAGIGLDVDAVVMLKAGPLHADVSVDAKNDTVSTVLNWYNNGKRLLAGEIAMRAMLQKMAADSAFTADVEVLPTELILYDKLWEMNHSRVWSNMKEVHVDDFGLQSSDGQILNIDGNISDNPDIDGITLLLNDISLDYISDLLPEETSISFGGRVSGFGSVKNLMTSQPEITADVVSERFSFNNAYFGQAHATCAFDTENAALDFGGIVTGDDNIRTAELSGAYFFLKDSLDLIGHANGLDVRFIDYYIADVFGRVTGNAYGDVHIYGITKSKKVAVDVDAFAKDASISVDFLKNSFFFSDSIRVNKDIIDFGVIEITDAEGHKGVLSGHIGHNYFKNFKLDLNIGVDNMRILNTTKADSESFYGTAYGTGNVVISGDDKQINISCKAATNAGTRVFIPIDSYYASENSFITFMSTPSSDNAAKKSDEEEKSSTNLVIDIMLDATPDAEVQILIDSKTGDMLRATGTGNLRISYDINADDMKLYGTYQLDQGAYLFTFQSLLRKEFKIKEGSSIVWTGDVMNATINIDAYHRLTADLAEILDEGVLSNTGRTSVPVQCLLNLSGSLMQPTIKFDINLPNSDEELNRALKNVVNTEELMNRQIIGLLLLGKFLSNDNLATNNVLSQNELFSVISSTLSSQLNNWASQMFDNWGFGVNFRTMGEGETRSNEYEFNFQYTPNNRIAINGNVGYRDDAMTSNPFIGDFDFEYKLIQSGKLRAKAYTHTNDYREFKKGLTTQGIGLVYSESFNSLPELWQSWKNNTRQAKKERAVRREKRKARREEKRQERERKKAAKSAAKESTKLSEESEDTTGTDGQSAEDIETSASTEVDSTVFGGKTAMFSEELSSGQSDHADRR